MAKSDQPETSSSATQAPPAPQIQPTIEPDDLNPIYTNFARVTGSPEELILDFGLNTQPIGNVNTPVKISERLVMNYYTAKRLWHTLAVSLQRHEEAFGVLETDISKRVVPQNRNR
jgi:Protein of unknown function (DUF3467)